MKQLLRPWREWIAKRAIALARGVSSDEGWSRTCHDLGAPSMLHGLLALRTRGVALAAVVDGGACIGDWTRLLRKVYPQVRVLMVEPQGTHREALRSLCSRQGPGLEVAHVLLGPSEQSAVPFNVLDDGVGGTGSSVFAERSDVPRHVVATPMNTLEALVATRAFPTPDLIKLDVQGFELEALKGAGGLLDKVPFVLLEVSVMQYNEGSPLMQEVLEWMRSRGYRVLDIFDLTRRRDGRLIQVDVLFVRDDARPPNGNDAH